MKDYADYISPYTTRCLAVYHGKVKECKGFVELSKGHPDQCKYWTYDTQAKCKREVKRGGAQEILANATGTVPEAR